MSLSERWEDITPNLNPILINSIKKSFGFENIMPVQKACIPLFIKNHDVAIEVYFISSCN